MRSRGGAGELEAGAAGGEESDEEDDEDEDEDEDEGEEDALPDTVERHCTDVPCLLVFVLGHIALAFSVSYALRHGNLDRDTSFSEGYSGDPCGFGSNWADPFLLFCRNGTSAAGRPTLDTDDAICVAKCPSSNESVSNESESCNGYPTKEFMGMMCKPVDKNLTKLLQGWFREHAEAKVVIRFHTLRNTWMLLVMCALLAITVYLLYILFLAECAGCLVWSVFTLLTVLPLASGVYFLHCWHEGGCNDDLGLELEENDPRVDLASGAVLVAVGLTFACSAYNRGDSIDLAVSCLEAACDCIVHTGALRLVPLVALVQRCLVLVVVTATFMLLLSCGKQLDDSQALPMLGGALVYHTAFSPKEWAYLGVLAVMFFWDFHFVTALTDFVSMYLTELWFFRSHGGEGGMPRFALFKAYWAACRYHCGTLSLGALVLGLTLPLRAVLGSVADQARTAHNPVTLLLGAVCCFCVDCYERCLAPLSKEAYMQLCLSSRPFWEASRNALAISRTEEEAVKLLNGVTLFFQLGGLLCVAFLGHAMTLLVVTNCGTFASPASPSFVYNKQLVAIAGTVASSVAALPFMMIFDTVSDTIIFCYSVQKHRARSRLREQGAGRYCGCLTASLPCARPRSGHGHGHSQPALASAAAKGAPGSPRSARQVGPQAQPTGRPSGKVSVKGYS